MPRIPRSQLPSPAYYHVTSRGVEQRRIVLDERDRESWFTLLVDVTKRFGWKLHAWNLLDNHFHLLVETTQPELSRGMQRLNSVHAMRFNRRYARSGHLFQGRFDSRVLEGDEHLAHVADYVYDNSTRVGLRGWPWRCLATAHDYSSSGDDGGVLAQRSFGQRDRAPEPRRDHPPRRGARPLQRADVRAMTMRVAAVVVAALFAAGVAGAQARKDGLPAYISGYAGWQRVNGDPIRGGSSAHQGVKNVYASRRKVGRRYPAGAIVVKTGSPPGKRWLSLVATMRRTKGTANGGWRWEEFTRTSPTARFGKVAFPESGCAACHMQAKANDYVFTRR